MIEYKEYSAKTVADAIALAEKELGKAISESDVEVLEKESSGFLGLFNKSAKIRVKVESSEASDKDVKTEAADVLNSVASTDTVAPASEKEAMAKKPINPNVTTLAKEFLDSVFAAMEIDANVSASLNETEATIEVQVSGTDMGILIGKRGQTLDSLQYLTSLVVNKESDNYVKVKLDTENYRERRKETLENLASNIAIKVKKTHRAVSLEPMNPYERRIIHSALQNDKYVETHSEGEEPYRKVVITPKKGVSYNNNRYGKKPYDKKYGRGGNGGYNKKYSSKEFHKKYGADTKDYSTDYKKDYAAYLESKAAAKAEAAAKSESGEGSNN